jgi:hypothetical protein
MPAADAAPRPHIYHFAAFFRSSIIFRTFRLNGDRIADAHPSSDPGISSNGRHAFRLGAFRPRKVFFKA